MSIEFGRILEALKLKGKEILRKPITADQAANHDRNLNSVAGALITHQGIEPLFEKLGIEKAQEGMNPDQALAEEKLAKRYDEAKSNAKNPAEKDKVIPAIISSYDMQTSYMPEGADKQARGLQLEQALENLGVTYTDPATGEQTLTHYNDTLEGKGWRSIIREWTIKYDEQKGAVERAVNGDNRTWDQLSPAEQQLKILEQEDGIKPKPEYVYYEKSSPPESAPTETSTPTEFTPEEREAARLEVEAATHQFFSENFEDLQAKGIIEYDDKNKTFTFHKEKLPENPDGDVFDMTILYGAYLQATNPVHKKNLLALMHHRLASCKPDLVKDLAGKTQEIMNTDKGEILKTLFEGYTGYKPSEIPDINSLVKDFVTIQTLADKGYLERDMRGGYSNIKPEGQKYVENWSHEKRRMYLHLAGTEGSELYLKQQFGFNAEDMTKKTWREGCANRVGDAIEKDLPGSPELQKKAKEVYKAYLRDNVSDEALEKLKKLRNVNILGVMALIFMIGGPQLQNLAGAGGPEETENPRSH
jgi:hypothetical protein